MIKLYNTSKLPDEPMRTLLTMAHRLSGAKGTTVVRITRGSSRSASTPGFAHNFARVNLAFAKGKRRWDKHGRCRERMINCDGFVTLAPAVSYFVNYWKGWRGRDENEPAFREVLRKQMFEHAMCVAKQLFETGIHEFAHCRDYQNYKFVLGSNRTRDDGTRYPYTQRPCEVSAESAVEDAWETLETQPARGEKVIAMIYEVSQQLVTLAGEPKGINR